MILVGAAVCGLFAVRPAAAAEAPQVDPSEGCNKDQQRFPVVVTQPARIRGPGQVELWGGIWTCVGRDENNQVITRDWVAETVALSYYYEWGRTRRYGMRSRVLRTVQDPGTGLRTAVSGLTPTDLIPGLVYHYRLVGRSDRYPTRGWRRGADRTVRVPNRSATDRTCSNPTITRVSPNRLSPGDRLTISGRGLGRSGTLRVGPRTARNVVHWTPTRIVAVVPAKLNGPAKLTVICGGNVNSSRTPETRPTRITVR